MLQATVNDKFKFEIDPKSNDGWDLLHVTAGEFHFLHNGRSLRATVIGADVASKSFTIKVNGNPYTVSVQDEFDQLIKKLGMEKMARPVASDIKAPMPGMVLQVLVEVGQSVKKGESVLILEAMKMENVIKAPADCTVKAIHVGKGAAVEKGQVMVELA